MEETIKLHFPGIVANNTFICIISQLIAKDNNVFWMKTHCAIVVYSRYYGS